MKKWSKELIQELEPNTLVVLVFSAEWCGPCRGLHPIIDGLEKIYTDKKICFIEVDVDIEKEFVLNSGVRNIPFVQFLKNNKEVDRIMGLTPQSNYLEVIERLLN